jgi:hypothetical protein
MENNTSPLAAIARRIALEQQVVRSPRPGPGQILEPRQDNPFGTGLAVNPQMIHPIDPAGRFGGEGPRVPFNTENPDHMTPTGTTIPNQLMAAASKFPWLNNILQQHQNGVPNSNPTVDVILRKLGL